jgi:autotransporter family porin
MGIKEVKTIRKEITKNSAQYRSTLLIPILLLSLALIFTMGLGTVSAVSGSTIYVNGSSGNDSWNGQSATHQTGITGPKKSIKNATETVSKGGTINIANGIYTGLKNTQITISKSMVINGQSTKGTIINGLNSWILHIQGGVNFKIANITFTNGKYTFASGIYNDGNMKLEGCSFKANSASISAGVIFNMGQMNIKNCYFSANHANNIAQGFGGVIYNAGPLNIYKSVFKGNKAIYGGAIFNMDAINLTDTSFTGNTAHDGGAIYNYGGTLNVNNCSFNGNYAKEGAAGAICKNGGELTVKNTSFNHNSGFAGGALYSYDDLTSVLNCTFTDNGNITDNTMGGGIFLYSGHMIVKDSNFTGNSGSQGGAIENGDKMQITRCNFINNTSTMVGGVIMNDYNTLLTVTSCTFLKNGKSKYGGSVLYNGGTATIHYSRIIGEGTMSVVENDGTADVSYNWWGSNHPNFIALISGPVETKYKPWLYMTIKTLPKVVSAGSTSKVVASFNQVFDGSTLSAINPQNGHIPDGTPVNYTATNEYQSRISTIKYTTNGVATATLYSNDPGIIDLSVTTDKQTLNSTVTILPSNSWKNNGTKTIGMQDTGIPIAPLTVALMSMIAGLAATRRK